MKTEEDEAFDDLAKKQGGGFQAKRAAAADKLQEPTREALKLALEALKVSCDMVVDDEYAPLGWSVSRFDEVLALGKEALALPAPQREWVGLTDDDLADIWYKGSLDWMEFARAHEAALKEKNNGT